MKNRNDHGRIMSATRLLKIRAGLVGVLLLLPFGYFGGGGWTEQSTAFAEGGIPGKEVRALWVVRTSIKDKKSIQAIIDFMKRRHFNTAIVQVRGRGDAFYRSDFVPAASGLEPGLDPLAEFLRLARPAGISVHAWVNAFLAADMETLRSAPPQHLIYTKKEWFIKDRTGRSMLQFVPGEFRRANVEGAFLDPSLPEVRAYNIQVIREILDRYKVDGIHLDYIRYPSSITGSVYDFGSPVPRRPPGAKSDPEQDALARSIRTGHVTQMVAEVRTLLRDRYRGVILTAAVWPNRQKITDHVFQNWPDWLRGGLLDYAFLMAYYNSKEIYDARMGDFRDPQLQKRMVIGIGVYSSPRPEVTSYQFNNSRAIGAAGVCYFDAGYFLKRETALKNLPGTLRLPFQEWRDHGLRSSF